MVGAELHGLPHPPEQVKLQGTCGRGTGSSCLLSGWQKGQAEGASAQEWTVSCFFTGPGFSRGMISMFWLGILSL